MARAESRPLALEDCTVVDVDSHLGRSLDALLPYVENEPVRRVLDRMSEGEFRRKIFTMTRPAPRWNRTDDDPLVHNRSADPEVKQAFLDEFGIDYAILTPPYSGIASVNHSRIAVALTRAYNRWLADHFFDADDRFRVTIAVPNQKPSVAAEEIDRWAGEDAVAGVQMPASGLIPPAGHEWYDPIYRAAEEHGLPVCMHSHSAHSTATFPVQRYWAETFIENHLFCFPVESMWHLTSLLFRGAFEKFPDLQFVMQECGVEWLPWMSWRMDDHYLENPQDVPFLERRPSEYLRRQFNVSTQPLGHTENHEHLARTLEMAGGADTVMFSTDHAHPDFDPPSEVFDPISAHLDSEEVRGIMGEHAMDVFGIE